MKRTISLFIAMVICIFLITCSLADGNFDFASMDLSELTALYGNVLAEINKRSIPVQEITSSSDNAIFFRGLDWHISATNFQDKMKEQGIAGSVRKASSCPSWEFKQDGGTIESVDSLSDCGYKYSSSPEDLNVGGFSISNIDAYFTFTFDDNEVYEDQEHSSLYYAKYTFSAIDGQTTYTVLANKLSSLYGDGIVGNTSTGWWSTGGDYHTFTDWTVWYGSDNTAAVLWHKYETLDADNTLKSDHVYLLYGKTNSLSTLTELKAAMAREELEKAVNSESVDGL